MGTALYSFPSTVERPACLSLFGDEEGSLAEPEGTVTMSVGPGVLPGLDVQRRSASCVLVICTAL